MGMFTSDISLVNYRCPSTKQTKSACIARVMKALGIVAQWQRVACCLIGWCSFLDEDDTCVQGCPSNRKQSCPDASPIVINVQCSTQFFNLLKRDKFSAPFLLQCWNAFGK